MVLVVLVVGDKDGECLCLARARVVRALSSLDGFRDLCGYKMDALSVDCVEAVRVKSTRTGAVVSAWAFALGVGSGRFQCGRSSANAHQSKKNV